jgi:CRP/FNR family transcriptional regulator, anaerobic regulatory protein
MPEASPLELRLAAYLPLTFAERDALRWLERRERRYAAGEVVVREGEENAVIHVVASGWLHGSVKLRKGGRQILRFYFVGDLTTTFSIAWGHCAATLTAVSPCTLYEMPREALGRLFHEHPRLGALLYGVSASEQVAMADRLTSVGRTDGMTRIATLLLDIRSRLRVIDGIDGSTFALPLTQQDLGDEVGLTKAHVNRTLKALEAEGLIEREGKIIRLVEVEKLAAMVDFNDRHHHVAVDWLPPNTRKVDLDHQQAAKA